MTTQTPSIPTPERRTGLRAGVAALLTALAVAVIAAAAVFGLTSADAEPASTVDPVAEAPAIDAEPEPLFGDCEGGGPC